MTAADFQKKLERDRRDRIDRGDPDRMVEALVAQGVKFVKTQMRTLVFEDAEQLERLLRTSPEIGSTFICMTRDSNGNAQL